MAVKPIVATPESGGRLITRRSNVAGGIHNYVLKRDFRRDMDKEIRQEGDALWHPNLSVDIGKQPSPLDQDYVVTGFSNGGFELDDDNDGIPDGWIVTATGGVFAIDDAILTEGEKSIRFTSTLGTESGYIESEEFLPVVEGQRFSIKFNAFASSAGRTIQAEFRWFDSGGNYISSTMAVDEDAGTMWRAYSRLTSPPSTAASVKLRLTGKVTADAHIGTVWFDDVRLVGRDLEILPITMLGEFRRPNGMVAVIAATQTTIYRFNYEGEARYVADSGSDPYVKDGYVVTGYVEPASDDGYMADGYVQSAIGSWTIIGSGFSRNGNRWQAIPVGPGYVIFNNGYDLPVSYQINESEVVPIYEIREAGIAKVGTIAEYSGALMAADVSTLKDSAFEDNFAHISPPASTKIKQYGSVKSLPHLATSSFGGAVDLGISFSGMNVSFADSPTLEPSIDFCIEATVKITNDNDDDHTVFGKGGSYRLCVKPQAASGGKSTFSLQVLNSTVLIEVACSVEFTNGHYHHLAVSVLDGNDFYFFIDGVMVEHVVGSISSPDVTANAAACGDVIAGFTGTDGGMVIAELRLWTAFRTIEEVESNFTADVTGQTGLSAYWKFDDTGGTAADSTGNGNTGTLNGGAAFVASGADVDSFVEMTKVAQNTLARVSNVATFYALSAHGFTTGQQAIISGAADVSYNTASPVTVTVIDPYRFTYPSVGADGSTTTASVQRSIFETGHVGKRLSFFNGMDRDVTKFISTVKVKVDGVVTSLTGHNYSFYIISESEAVLTGTVTKTATLNTLAGVGTAFTTELSVGQSIRVGTSEEVRKIASITNDTTATVDSVWGVTQAGATAHRVTDYTVLSNFAYFDTTMIGKKLFWPDGTWRTITAFNNTRRVEVSNHRTVAESAFLLENTTAYDAITDGNKFDRVMYRMAWSALDRPRVWEASPPGAIEAGSVLLTLNYQAKSFERGDQITITGAGINGGNLTATIRTVHPDHQNFTLSAPASTTVEDADVQRTDSIGSIVGYLDDIKDTSAIIAMLELAGVLVVYHDRSIAMCVYTGNADAPFAVRNRYGGSNSGSNSGGSKTPYYRFTITRVSTGGNEYHIYAGRNSFYRFDLVRQTPTEMPEFEDVENVFFGADVSDINKVYAVDNPITKQVFFQFPSSTADQGLCYDYLFSTFGTTQANYTAMAAVRRITGIFEEPSTHDWFICASPQGKVLLFGKTDQPEPQWGGRSEIFNRQGSDYLSTLKSCLWGGRMNEVFLTEYVLELDSDTSPAVNQITIKLYGYETPSQTTPTLLHTEILEAPAEQPLISAHFERHFFQDEIIASGNAPCRITARIVNVGGMESHSHARREIPVA